MPAQDLADVGGALHVQLGGDPALACGGGLPKLDRNRHFTRIGSGQASQIRAGKLVPAQRVGQQCFGLVLTVRTVLRRTAVSAIERPLRAGFQQAEQLFSTS